MRVPRKSPRFHLRARSGKQTAAPGRGFVSMVAPSAPRDARSKIPPGPEGSNGIDRRGRRGQPAGPPPFPPHAIPRTAGASLHGPVATGRASPGRTRLPGAAATVSIDAGAGASRRGHRLSRLMPSREQPALHCTGPWRRAGLRRDGHAFPARQQRYRSTRAPGPAGGATAFPVSCHPAKARSRHADRRHRACAQGHRPRARPFQGSGVRTHSPAGSVSATTSPGTATRCPRARSAAASALPA